VETVRDYAIFLLDPQGVVRSWNAGAERIKGYTADEIIGQHFSVFYPRTEEDQAKPPHELRVASEEGRYEEEGWRIRKDGTRFWANVVITALRDKSGELVGFAKVTRDLTERKKAEEHRGALLERERQARIESEEALQQLRHARQEAATAEEAVRVRDEFVRIAAHELKTPLTGAKMGVQLLRRSFRDVPLTPGQTLALDTIGARIDKLATLVGALLDTTRMDAGALHLNVAEVDLVELAQGATQQWRDLPNGHEIVITDAPERLIARADPLRIEQVLANLIDNAVKFSPKGGRIEVSLAEGPTAATISVRDHGLGVQPKDRARLFERFYQAHPDRSGMGLGLHITRQFVEMHGGTIEAEWPDDGGTRFVVSLPLKAREENGARDQGGHPIA
jgi:PAS domain S-box-containing protein